MSQTDSGRKLAEALALASKAGATMPAPIVFRLMHQMRAEAMRRVFAEWFSPRPRETIACRNCGNDVILNRDQFAAQALATSYRSINVF